MMSQLQKAILLARKTGDKLIVFDSANPEAAYVVMTIDQYERIAGNQTKITGLTEQELLDKINRDIAIWKSEQEDAGWSLKKYIHRQVDDMESFSQDWNKTMEKPTKGKGPLWRIPRERKEAAEEVIEEDRHYLEDVPF
jgi:hypothetical protein